jgi:hypothetical protein
MPHQPKYPFRTMELGEMFTLPAGVWEFNSAQIYCYNRNRVLAPKRFTPYLNPDGSITITRRS